MDVFDRTIIVTGGASGIGAAMCRRFAEEGSRVVVSDIDAAGARSVAGEFGGLAIPADVAVEDDIRHLVVTAEEQCGPVDVFCSNAGIAVEGGEAVPDSDWDRIWSINVMAHIYAARAVLPGMLDRGGGYLVQTASAAGLLTQIGSAPYAVTKHASIAFAEWLAVTYGARGIRVSVLAPQAVRTAMTAKIGEPDSALAVAAVDGMIEPELVAAMVVNAMREERFLILPHPEVATYFQRKAADYDRWIGGMQRLQVAYQPDP